MAFALLSDGVSDLTLGKPTLPALDAAASVRDALVALKLSADVSEISVWDCPPSCRPRPPPPALGAADPKRSAISGGKGGSTGGSTATAVVVAAAAAPRSHNPGIGEECHCIGKVCMQKIICYLATDRSLNNLAKALEAPVTVLLGEKLQSVKQIDPEASVVEALNLIVDGAQNLVVQVAGSSRKYGRHSKNGATQKRLFPQASMASCHASKHNGREYCWLTQEDVLRFLLGHINVFSPLPMMSIQELNLINKDVLMVGVEEEAILALDKIKAACLRTAAVAVVEKMDDKGKAVKLVGEISCSTLESCNEAAALALATLSVGDFLLYTQGETHSFSDTICAKLRKKLGSEQSKLGDVSSILQELEMWDESSDEESGADSPTGPHDLSSRWASGHSLFRGMGYVAKSRSGPIFCRPRSSLIAVILQALAHREHYVWVTDDDGSLVGIVTFLNILTVMFNHLSSSV